MSERDFFSNLPEFNDFFRVTDPANYFEAPQSWYVVITDVRNSGNAIENGRYRDVNALGVASIVALCNATPDIELPYIFGGDGATLLLPGTELPRYLAALRRTRRLAEDAFELDLRTVLVPIAELKARGFPVLVGRFRASEHIALAMLAGSGVFEAERWAKSPELADRYSIDLSGDNQASFEGFECRWQTVKSRRGVVLSLLVRPIESDSQYRRECFEQFLNASRAIVGLSNHCPISPGSLKLRGFRGDYSIEARVRSESASGQDYLAAYEEAKRKTQIGRIMMRLGLSIGGFDGKGYPPQLVRNTDFRKFDGILRMVIDCTPAEADAIEQNLESQRAKGRLVYGLNRSRGALITCFVRSYRGNHIHFVDGADGGYAAAAQQLKMQSISITPQL